MKNEHEVSCEMKVWFEAKAPCPTLRWPDYVAALALPQPQLVIQMHAFYKKGNACGR
jgi:hypothetical protein